MTCIYIKPTHMNTHTLPFPRKVEWAGKVRMTRKKEQTIKTLINIITLPSPLRSSAGSRSTCRKQDRKAGSGHTAEKEKE